MGDYTFEIMNNVYKCGDCTTIVIPANVHLDNIILQLHVKLNVRFYMKLLEDICQNSPHIPFIPTELVDMIVSFMDLLEDVDPIHWLLIDHIDIQIGTFSHTIDARWNMIHYTMIYTKTMRQIIEKQSRNVKEFYLSLPLTSLLSIKNCYHSDETILKIKWKTPMQYKEELHKLITYTDHYDLYTLDPCIQVLESYVSYRLVQPTIDACEECLTCPKLHSYTRKLIKARSFDVVVPLRDMCVCRVYITLSDPRMIMKDVQLSCDHPHVTSHLYCYPDNIHYTSLNWRANDDGLIVTDGRLRFTGDLIPSRFSGTMYIHLVSKEKVSSLYITSE